MISPVDPCIEIGTFHRLTVWKSVPTWHICFACSVSVIPSHYCWEVVRRFMLLEKIILSIVHPHSAESLCQLPKKRNNLIATTKPQSTKIESATYRLSFANRDSVRWGVICQPLLVSLVTREGSKENGQGLQAIQVEAFSSVIGFLDLLWLCKFSWWVLLCKASDCHWVIFRLWFS